MGIRPAPLTKLSRLVEGNNSSFLTRTRGRIALLRHIGRKIQIATRTDYEEFLVNMGEESARLMSKSSKRKQNVKRRATSLTLDGFRDCKFSSYEA